MNCRPPLTRWGRWVLVLLVGVGVFITSALTAPAASAHNVLEGTDPMAGAVVARVPVTVTLTFDQPALGVGSEIVITGPEGPVQAGPPRLVDRTVAQDIEPGAPAGAYQVLWRVTSADGHPVSGKFTFTAAAAGAGTPTASTDRTTVTSGDSAQPAAAPRSGSPAGSSPTPFLLIAGVILVALVVVALVASAARRRRRMVR